MRICFVAHPSHTNSRSWIRYFAEELKHDVHVIAVTREKDDVPGATMHYIPVNIEQKWRYFFVIPKLRRLVRKIAPDLLVGYRIQSNGFLAACTGYHPLVLAGQDETLVTPPDSKILERTVRFAIKRGDWFNAWGPHMGRRMVELGADPKLVVVRTRGVDTRAFYPPSEEAPARREGPPTLVSTRGLYPMYRHDLLVAAMAEVVRDFPDARLLIIGRGPAEADIREDVAERGLEKNVELCGYVEHKGVAPYLRRAHVYVSVIATDGVSSSLLEAMACGCYPVVAGNSANRLWITDGRNGSLFEPGDAKSLADRLRAALSDASQRDRAAAENLATIRRDHDWHRNMRAMEAEYEALLRRRASG